MIATGCDSDKQTAPQEMKTAPAIVTQDNFPQAFTNMRLGSLVLMKQESITIHGY